MTGQRHLLTKPAQSRLTLVLLSLVLGGICAGCLPSRSPKTELTMQVSPSSQPGVYSVVGKTNLPDQTRITIQAVRSLRPVRGSSRLTNQAPTYAILARQPIAVIDGKWQTTLTLLNMTPSGKSLENWQTHNLQLGLNLEPEQQVTFQAVTDPADRSLKVEQPSENMARESLIVRFTPDGKSYLQSEQALAIAPPSLQAAQPSSAMNPRLGAPTIVTVQAVSMQTKGAVNVRKQIDAPLSPQEFLH